MRALTLVTVASLSLVGCGGSGSPAAPTPPPPPPAAQLVIDGDGAWRQCSSILGLCIFQGGLRNTGAGCAGNVRGVTRFIDANGTQSAPFNWTLPAAAAVLRPNEVVAYQINAVPFALSTTSTRYQTEPAWDNVACQ
jgi:hypothetical protein